jgi:two-component system chemotaxis sensor kinase CheA
MDLDDEIIEEFLVESHENLDRLDRDLVQLEKTPSSPEILTSIFRTFHTVKGTSGFFGFEKLQNVTHVAESLLDKMREGELVANARITSVLLETCDAVRTMLAIVKREKSDGTDEHAPLIAKLNAILEAKPEPKAEAKVAPVPTASATSAEAPAPIVAPVDNSVRIDVGLLDQLMNLVSELVLERNRVVQLAAKLDNPAVQESAQRLSTIASELQTRVMRTRMQPLGTLFQKMPRVVRDLATALGKQVDVVLGGEETEVDRTILEGLRDPLTHIVRNSVDHGIEAPSVREEGCKEAAGCLNIRAYQEGGRVVVEVADDGGGIRPDKVKKKALERGLITQARAEKMTDAEAISLIFLPGFSTAEVVTNVSGRGVGMDVVRTNVEKLGGVIEVSSVPGEGTTLKIRIPLTVAILPVLIVQSGGESLAIPQPNVREIARVPRSRYGTELHSAGGARMLRLRGSLLPLVDPVIELGLERSPEAIKRLTEQMHIVVLEAGDRVFGLVVDSVQDTEEIVVKPLQPALKAIGVYSGATILGDGKVVLILDVANLAQRARIAADRVADAVAESTGEESRENARWLLFGLGERRKMAMRFDRVQRLEELNVSAVETVGRREVLQHNGQIIPLFFVSRVLEEQQNNQDPHVLICSENGRTIGLVVDRILDVVEGEDDSARSQTRERFFETIVIGRKATELLDVSAIVRAVDPTFFDKSRTAEG